MLTLALTPLTPAGLEQEEEQAGGGFCPWVDHPHLLIMEFGHACGFGMVVWFGGAGAVLG